MIGIEMGRITLTIIGMPSQKSGIFLPKRFTMNPKTMFETVAPMDSNEVIHDDSSIEIFPLGNGDSSDINKTFIELDHPSEMPN